LSCRTKKVAGANRKARDRSFGNHSLTILKHCFKTGLELDDSTQRGTKCSFSSSPLGCFLRSSRRRCCQFDLILKPIIDVTDIAAPDGLPLMSWSAPWAAKQYPGSTKATDAVEGVAMASSRSKLRAAVRTLVKTRERPRRRIRRRVDSKGSEKS
jgi:hypothetical protein